MWPSFYPTHIQVPPSDSIDADGVFFRLVKQSPPAIGCFKSTHEEQPTRYKKFLKKPGELPNVYGTSFYETSEELSRLQLVFPDALGDKLIAKGNVTPMTGKMKKTRGPNHYTIWIKKGGSPHKSFFVMGGGV